jgi:broad specificity phosphatase PhoE
MKLLALLAIACPLVGLVRQQSATMDVDPAGAPIAVLLVRHAEADATDPAERDPGLSAAGAARADELARLLGRSGATHLFSSEYRRTRATLAPLAEALGREITVLAARDDEAQVAALRALPPRSIAVVCGHSNTIPALVARLGATLPDLVAGAGGAAVLEHSSHDRMPMLLLHSNPEAPPLLVELTYGE